jgi:hypothetical protein
MKGKYRLSFGMFHNKPMTDIDNFYIYFAQLKDSVIASRLNYLYLQNTCSNMVKTKYITGSTKVSNPLDSHYIWNIQEFVGMNVLNRLEYEIFNDKKDALMFIKAIYFQVIYFLYCADIWFGFRHRDLHYGNVRTTGFNGDALVYKNINNKIYYIPRNVMPYKINIIDFDRSYMSTPFFELVYIKDWKKKILNDFFNNMFSFVPITGEVTLLTGENLKISRNDLNRFHALMKQNAAPKLKKKDRIEGLFEDPFFKKMTKPVLQKRSDFYIKLLEDPFFDDFLKYGKKYTDLSKIPDENISVYKPLDKKMKLYIKNNVNKMMNIGDLCL